MQKDFSYPLTVSELPSVEQHYKLKAKDEELALLAQILKVPAVSFFAADIRLKFDHDEHMITLWGHIKTDMTRTSVVSLEDFKQVYDFDFETSYDTGVSYDEYKKKYDDWEDDAPGFIVGGILDLVEMSVEQIALKMDDYPRKKDEVFEYKQEFSETDSGRHNPFEALSVLKK